MDDSTTIDMRHIDWGNAQEIMARMLAHPWAEPTRLRLPQCMIDDLVASMELERHRAASLAALDQMRVQLALHAQPLLYWVPRIVHQFELEADADGFTVGVQGVSGTDPFEGADPFEVFDVPSSFGVVSELALSSAHRTPSGPM